MQITEQNKPYLIGIIIIALLIIGSVYLLITMIGQPVDNIPEDNQLNETEQQLNETEVQKTAEECLAELGYTEFVFLHSPYCGYCKTMMPIVEGLIAEGYKIQIVNSQENSSFAKISNCITLKNSVPQFICNKNGVATVGAMSKEDLITVYNKCQ